MREGCMKIQKRKVSACVVHLQKKQIARVRIGCCVGRQKKDFFARLYHTLLDTFCEHVTNGVTSLCACDSSKTRGGRAACGQGRTRPLAECARLLSGHRTVSEIRAAYQSDLSFR